MKIPNYTKILRKSYLPEEFKGSHFDIEEKVDGSQFSFYLGEDGELHFKSKGRVLLRGSEGDFEKAVTALCNIKHLVYTGRIYRGEYLRKPRHNKISYGRVPKHHVILWEVQTPEGVALSREELEEDALRMGMDVVPSVYSSILGTSLGSFDFPFPFESILGGEAEGYVIKFRKEVDPWTGKSPAAFKVVSEAFSELKVRKPKVPGSDAFAELADTLTTEARWEKAVHARRDNGELLGTTKDIGPLVKHIQEDVFAEEEVFIKEELFKHFKKVASSRFVKGFAEWYIDSLTKKED